MKVFRQALQIAHVHQLMAVDGIVLSTKDLYRRWLILALAAVVLPGLACGQAPSGSVTVAAATPIALDEDLSPME